VTTSIWLIRHAAYDYRPSEAGDAASDFGLNELGRRQAALLARRLRDTREIKPSALYCSTLDRALQTAAILGPVFDLAPVALAELCEWRSGSDSLGEEAFMSKWGDLTVSERKSHRFHSGSETIEEFTARVYAGLGRLVDKHHDEEVALVVHGGVIEAAFALFVDHGIGPFVGGYPAADHTSITLWRRSERSSQWVQEFANDTHHLRGAT
jgi:2,3-bisphosphoglycerate-dependent phosphoglycerate mutase